MAFLTGEKRCTSKAVRMVHVQSARNLHSDEIEAGCRIRARLVKEAPQSYSIPRRLEVEPDTYLAFSAGQILQRGS